MSPRPDRPHDTFQLRPTCCPTYSTVLVRWKMGSDLLDLVCNNCGRDIFSVAMPLDRTGIRRHPKGKG